MKPHRRTASIAPLIACAVSACHEPPSKTGDREPELAAAVERVRSRPGPIRRLTNDELTPELQRRAVRILERHADDPTGTQVAFDAGGRRYLGRIEEHYHPPGGSRRPWGSHKGVSLFVVEPAGSP